MKTLFSTLLVGALSVGAAEGVYANGLDVKIVEAGKKEFGLIVKNASGEDFQVQLVDRNKYELLKADFKTEVMVAKKINLEYLPSGEYELIVSDSDEIITVPVKLTEINVFIQDKDRSKVERLSFEAQGLEVKVNLAGKDSLPVKVLIYNSNGDLVHKQTYNEKVAKTQVFNFDRMGADTYEFEVYYAGSRYSQFVTLN